VKSKRQTQFKFEIIEEKLAFGGELLKSAKNRHARPVSCKNPMHLVLRSSKAKGRFSFAHHSNLVRVKQVIDRHCLKFGLKLVRFSNNFNHLHLLLKFPSREIYLRFIRSLTAQLAMAVTGAKKLSSMKSILGARRFWDHRPFTRVVRGIKAYRIVFDYIRLNELEACGSLPKRAGRLRDVTREERWYFSSEKESSEATSNANLSFSFLDLG
jgi:putative transposase